MLTATLTALALSTAPAVEHIAPPPLAVIVVAGKRKGGRRDDRRSTTHTRTAITMGAMMLLLDDEQDRCEAEYAVHYGPNVEAFCTRDILNADSIPHEARQQWQAWREQGMGN